MGELLLCSRRLAQVPYEIDTISLKVYSLEEICYYLKHNIELVEPEFMDEALCEWIRHELKMPDLAERLGKIITKRQGLLAFVTVLMQACDYCTGDEILTIRRSLEEFEHKSRVECAKIRADRFLMKKRYHQCILEYRRLLESPELGAEGIVFEGSLWHNMGTAYAGLFFFEEAAECYRQAYERNRKKESYEHAKAAGEMMLLTEEPGGASEPQEVFFQTGIGNLAVADNLLGQWKEEYRKSCR